MTNPFSLYWNKNWTFQIVHMEGGIYLEAKGLGIQLRKPFLPTENPLIAADNLVCIEDKNRKSLFNSWKSKSFIA
ncbi:copper-binding protein [Prochlorococcus marinus]|uniref:Copper-binding protein n=1 Tax=Prochlorococcus marinus XMU1408 TaxID=2213228 RepID=A0A318R741_PROMR|nr:copper-binding protein [Prochlorococcus marinus]MBW3042442.1 copper-binding protein [Prochlorococcus marinus str. XMU1408]PYE01178.1 copper-binding protein [Prochlorococcus marinus XMU1408]